MALPTEQSGFLIFVCSLIFLVDCAYIALLAKARKRARQAPVLRTLVAGHR